MARARRRQPPAFSVTMLLTMGVMAMAVLGGLVWLALAYNHAGLLAVLLPILPILFSFFVEQCRHTMEEWREDEAGDEPEQRPPPSRG